MSDNYQAIYDAVRSRIGNTDIGSVVRDAIGSSFDISHTQAMLRDELLGAAWEMQRPSVLFRPVLKVDGNQWCALYGGNLQDGCAGFGDTPDLAMQDFDKQWKSRKP